MKLKFLITIALFFAARQIVCAQQCLLIFQHEYSQELNDVDGMNIGHQLITALIQKSCPILVSQNVWNHLAQRCSRCATDSAVSNSVASQAKTLIQTVRSAAQATPDAAKINQRFNQSWYDVHFGALKKLDSDAYKAVFFDQLCSLLPQLLTQWQGHLLQNGYVLLTRNAADCEAFKIPATAQELGSQLQQAEPAGLTVFDLVGCLSDLLNKQMVWSFYITGHGQHEKDVTKNIVAGLFINQFKNLLLLLDRLFTTNILVYSSCYSSGMHLVVPYTHYGQDLLLNYPVIATCLTDAPVYVMGYPAGLKLPPYDAAFCLQQSDIGVNGLNWSMMQNFNDFCRLCQMSMDLKNIAQSVTVYQECQMGRCNLAQIENIPLVRKVQEPFFVPLDTQYVHCIVHDDTKTVDLQQKQGLLWYCKQYHGTIVLSDVVAQFVSMLPEDAAIWIKAIDAKRFSMIDCIKKAFLSIDDMQKIQIFMCEKLVTKEGLYERVIIIPKSDWVPTSLKSGELGICLYQQGRQSYAVAMEDKKPMIAQKLSREQKKQVTRLWQILLQDAQYKTTSDGSMVVLSSSAVHDDHANHIGLLQRCRQEKICS